MCASDLRDYVSLGLFFLSLSTMLFHFTYRIVGATVAFLYPGYASYKTLSQRPASEEDLERWLMYWSVLGCVVAVEYTTEWLVSWIPFYYTLKTLFLLYLALPQTRGSSYLYINHLQPFFHRHESQIDATLASLKAKVYTFLQERFRALWDQIVAAAAGQGQVVGRQANAAAPSAANPAGPTQLLSSLWGTYGPGIIASGSALLRQTAAAAGTRPPATPAFTPSSSGSTQSVLDRRRELEEELANLAAADPNAAVLTPPTGSRPSASRGSSDSDLRNRDPSTSGRFEEIEVPSDVEGYDVDGPREGEVGYVAGGRPGAAKRGSWFGGWGGSNVGSSKGGYERVKSD